MADLGIEKIAKFARVVGRTDRTIRNWMADEKLSYEAAEAIGKGLLIPWEVVADSAERGLPLPDQYRGRASWLRRMADTTLGRPQAAAQTMPAESFAPPSDASKLLGRAATALAQNNPVDIGSIVSQIDVDGMSRVELARRALEILKRLRDTADTEQAKQRFRGAILSCERIIQSNENQRKKQERKAKGA